jgi:methylenetetrahydrofolate reductase (NADPH)
VYKRARVFDGYVDAINATDGSGANCHMSSLAVCALLTRVGYAPIMQISCRDKNRIAIQGDILGGAAMGVCNMLCLTGDGVQAGRSSAGQAGVRSGLRVAARDRAHAARRASFSKRPQDQLRAARVLRRRRESVGLPHEWRAQRLAKKVAAGRAVHPDAVLLRLPLLRASCAGGGARAARQGLHPAGVGPLRSAKTAEWMRKNVPGMHVPDAIDRAPRGRAGPGARRAQHLRRADPAIREMRGISGVHVMAYRQEESVAEIVDRSGVLKGACPGIPGATPTQFSKQDRIMTDTVISSATKEVVIGFDRPFVIIGERINPTGARSSPPKWPPATFSRVEADARAQVEAGAHMLDVNAGHPARR